MIITIPPGVVTKEEFKTALVKAGIHLDRPHMTQLYNSLSNKRRMSSITTTNHTTNTTNTNTNNTNSASHIDNNSTTPTSSSVPTITKPPYTTDEGISIDDLVTSIELRSTASAYKHVHNNSNLNDSLQEDKFGKY